MTIKTGQKIIHDKDEILRRIDLVYGNIQKKIAWEILKNSHDVEDCLNEVRLKLSNHLDKIEDLGSIEAKAYICKTTKNTAIDMYRKKKNEPLAVGIGDEVRAFAANEGKHQLDVLERYELTEEVKDALNMMKPIERKIILMHRYDDYTYEEIGEVLGMSKDAVRKRADRALDNLRLKVGKR